MKDVKKILQRLLALADCFDKKITETVQEMYLEALMPYEDEVIILAISRAVKELKFFPKIAEIIGFIEGPKQSEKDQAAVAWQKLILAIEKQGSYKSVAFDDQAIMTAVNAMGGWIQVCQWTEEELHWRQSEFERLYSGLVNCNGPDYLPGRHALAAIKGGTAPPEPVVVGDKKVLLFKKSDNEILKQIQEKCLKTQQTERGL